MSYCQRRQPRADCPIRLTGRSGTSGARAARSDDMGTAAKDVAQHTSGLNHLEAFPQPSDESSETTQSLGGTRPGHQHLSA